jgi:NADH:ubiquinone oxidoreductase subunit 5 (subunit L)/multisubunit Na+/H+ antiporter MnhA subunit
MIKKFYELKDLKAHKAPENSILDKAWKRFLDKWLKRFPVEFDYSSYRYVFINKEMVHSNPLKWVVMHMGIIVLGVFSNTIQGIEGAILLSLTHGIVSPALFICAGILYDRYHSRLIKYYRGLVISMPLFSIFFFILTLANMAVPLTGNFIGEFLSFLGSFQKNPIITAIAATSMVLVAAYSIWLYNRICFGNESIYLIKAKDLTRREFFLLLPLVFLTFLLGIYPNIILDSMHLSVSSLIFDGSNNFSMAFIPIMILFSGEKKDASIFMDLGREETAELVEKVGNTIAEGTIAFGTLSTGIAASKVPTPTAKTITIAAGTAST